MLDISSHLRSKRIQNSVMGQAAALIPFALSFQPPASGNTHHELLVQELTFKYLGFIDRNHVQAEFRL